VKTGNACLPISGCPYGAETDSTLFFVFSPFLIPKLQLANVPVPEALVSVFPEWLSFFEHWLNCHNGNNEKP